MLLCCFTYLWLIILKSTSRLGRNILRYRQNKWVEKNVIKIIWMKVDFCMISSRIFAQFSHIGYHFKAQKFFLKLKSRFCQRDPQGTFDMMGHINSYHLQSWKKSWCTLSFWRNMTTSASFNAILIQVMLSNILSDPHHCVCRGAWWFIWKQVHSPLPQHVSYQRMICGRWGTQICTLISCDKKRKLEFLFWSGMYYHLKGLQLGVFFIGHNILYLNSNFTIL